MSAVNVMDLEMQSFTRCLLSMLQFFGCSPLQSVWCRYYSSLDVDPYQVSALDVTIFEMQSLTRCLLSMLQFLRCSPLRGVQSMLQFLRWSPLQGVCCPCYSSCDVALYNMSAVHVTVLEMQPLTRCLLSMLQFLRCSPLQGVCCGCYSS